MDQSLRFGDNDGLSEGSAAKRGDRRSRNEVTALHLDVPPKHEPSVEPMFQQTSLGRSIVGGFGRRRISRRDWLDT
jgi:hypothetical protein